ncbi:MAG: glycosyltransferase family 4 protein [Mariprofundaceae bacterium]|nr:glycosyltransferase family 4 protein [Mariprofundaceae bacterium]
MLSRVVSKMPKSKNIRVLMTVSRSDSPRTGGEKSNWYLQQGLTRSMACDFKVIDFEKAPYWIHLFRGRVNPIFFLMINVWYCYHIFSYKPAIFIEDHYFSRHCMLVNMLLPLLGHIKIFFLVRDLRFLQASTWAFFSLSFKLGMKRANTVVFNSEATKKALLPRVAFNGAIKVIYPGFDKHQTLTFNRVWGSTPVSLLFAGVIRPLKELDLVIHALAEVKSRSWVLHIAGRSDADPVYFMHIQKEIQRLGLHEQVHFLGQLDRKELEQAYQQAELFILPSRNEAFGQVFLEAMSWKLPVLASFSGGAVEILEHSGGGLLLPVGDVHAWAQALEGLLSDAQMRESMGEKAWQRSEQFGGWQQMVDSFVLLIQKRDADA